MHELVGCSNSYKTTSISPHKLQQMEAKKSDRMDRFTLSDTSKNFGNNIVSEKQDSNFKI